MKLEVLKIILFVGFLLLTGCEHGVVKPVTSKTSDMAIYTSYAPAAIKFMPLTEVVDANQAKPPKIKVYISMLDSAGTQIKSPSVFRFELYQRLSRSVERKGKRIFIWPDIDMTAIAENNGYWQDFLRAYRFDLDFVPQVDQHYILQATCFTLNGKRLLAEIAF